MALKPDRPRLNYRALALGAATLGDLAEAGMLSRLAECNRKRGQRACSAVGTQRALRKPRPMPAHCPSSPTLPGPLSTHIPGLLETLRATEQSRRPLGP